MTTTTKAGEEWLSLGKAADCLNVHAATLRRWADNGDIPCLLTPGGHRRFALSDIVRFAQSRQRLSAAAVEQVWADQCVSRARYELTVRAEPGWLKAFDEDAREQNREVGQQLMALTLQYLSNGEDEAHILEEARKIGRQYGRNAIAFGLPLTDALQAAIFFRDMLVETALRLPESARIKPEANVRLLRRINKLLNNVHLAIAGVYDTGNYELIEHS